MVVATINPQSRLLVSFIEMLIGEDSVVRAVSMSRLGLAVSQLIENEEMENLYNKELFGYNKQDQLPEYRIIGKDKKIEIRIPISDIVNIYKRFELDKDAIVIIDNKKLRIRHLEMLITRFLDSSSSNVGKVLFEVLRPSMLMPEMETDQETMNMINKAFEKISSGNIH